MSKGKKEKSNHESVTSEVLKKVIEDTIIPLHNNLQLDIDTKINNLARMVARSFKEFDGKIETVERRLILTKEEILRKLVGTNSRINDFVLNHVKIIQFETLRKTVESFIAKSPIRRATR